MKKKYIIPTTKVICFTQQLLLPSSEGGSTDQNWVREYDETINIDFE